MPAVTKPSLCAMEENKGITKTPFLNCSEWMLKGGFKWAALCDTYCLYCQHLPFFGLCDKKCFILTFCTGLKFDKNNVADLSWGCPNWLEEGREQVCVSWVGGSLFSRENRFNQTKVIASSIKCMGHTAADLCFVPTLTTTVPVVISQNHSYCNYWYYLISAN